MKLDFAPDYLLEKCLDGKIVYWDEEKSIGIIETFSPKIKIYFLKKHIFYSAKKPQVGENITVFAEYKSDKNIWQATKVTSRERKNLSRNHKIKERNLSNYLYLFISISLISVAFYFIRHSIFLLSAFLLTSIINYLLFWRDKKIAIYNRDSSFSKRRIPESTLLFWTLIGGWAGGLIARYLHNHKTSKKSFIIQFYFYTLLNIGAVYYLLQKKYIIIKQLDNLIWRLINS